MLKKILRAIRNMIKHEVARQKFEREKQENRKRFAHFASFSNAMRTEDKPLTINYHDGRMMSQRHVTPQFYDPALLVALRGVVDDSRDTSNSGGKDSKDVDPGDCNDFSDVRRESCGASDAGVGPCSTD